MRRLHLFELHEQKWFPSFWRTMFQQSMGQAITISNSYRNTVDPFRRFLERTRANSFLDLCSGSAEPIIRLREWLEEKSNNKIQPKIIFSDLYPDLNQFRKLKEEYGEIVDFYPDPVNALSPPPGAPRVRTMFSALHHFHPEEVKAILSDAARNADGIAIFEATARTWKNMLMSLPIPIAAAIINGFMLRPHRFWHIIWSLAIPVVPLTAFFDGVISNLRSYTVEELKEFTESIDAPQFEWEIGKVPIPKTIIEATYLFGWRKELSL